MSLSKPLIAAAACVMLTACGFQPLYGPTGAASSQGAEMADTLAAVEIANIGERPGQKLRNALVDRLHSGGATTPVYRLVVNYIAGEGKLAISKDASVERYQLSFRATYQLQEKASGKNLLNAVARTTLVYDSLEEQYGLLASRENGYDRAIAEVADEIAIRVTAALRRPAPPPPAPAAAPAPAPTPAPAKARAKSGKSN